MPYGRRRMIGKDVVKANGQGPILREEALFHSDGQTLHGGISVFITGPRGSGKTTLNVQLSEGVMHYPITVRDRSYTQNLQPETVIYRVRKYDYFNTFFPSYWETAFPGWKPKPILMHQWVGNDYKFQFDVAGKIKELDMSECEIVPYETTDELIKNNLEPGSINLVCEPCEYEIPGDIIKSICLRDLHFKMKEAEGDSGLDPETEHELESTIRPPAGDALVAKLKQEIRQKKKMKKVQPQPAPSPIWWFELVERLLALKPQHEFVTLAWDEAHQIIPQYAQKHLFHLTAWLATSTLDQRRMNISLMAVSHDTSLIDYRIKKRMDYNIYMPRAVPDPSNSMVYQSLTAALEKGEYVIEIPHVRYGIDTFDRFEDQPPVVIVDGMKNYA